MDRKEYEIRPIHRHEWEDAMQLAWDTFLIFEAPEYSKEGVKNFQNFVRDPVLKKMFLKGQYLTYGAFVDQTMIGVVGVRNTNHISLLFVDQEYHHQGVATTLLKGIFSYVSSELGKHEMTVNSSPYAVGFYHTIGFCDIDKEITTDGIRYTPMKIDLKDILKET